MTLRPWLLAFTCLMAIPHRSAAMGGARADNYTASDKPVSAPGATVRRALGNEPVWSSLSKTPADFAKVWENGEIFKKYPVADGSSLYELQKSSAEIWWALLQCNHNDASEARLAYYVGNFCSKDPDWQLIKPRFVELLAALETYLKTTTVNDTNDSNFLSAYLYNDALRSAPLFNELLLETLARLNLYPESLDQPVMRLARSKGIPPKLMPGLKERIHMVDSAERSLLMTAKECEDYGLWPTLSGSVYSWGNLTSYFAMYADKRTLQNAPQYTTKLSVQNMMACGEHLIRWNLDVYLEVKDQVSRFRDEDRDADLGILFYRYLAWRNLQLQLGL